MKDQPLVIPPRFRPLFDAIFYREHDRVNVIAPTQDGKSTTIASACVLVAASTDERFTIVAPSEKKADIIMTWVREFATQHPTISSQLELDKDDNLDRLKRKRSQKHLTFKRGGAIQTLTLDAKNSKRSFEAAMGFGANNIIADEAGLIENKLWATVMRMLGGDIKESQRRKIIVKVGNPFHRNHFYKTSKSPRYHQVYHDYRDSIRDWKAGYYGYNPDFIEEMRSEAFFDVFYECNFPSEEDIDDQGYRQLIKSDQIRIVDLALAERVGTPMLGCDIAGGGDYNVFTMRWDNHAEVVHYDRNDDTMHNVAIVRELMEEYPQLKGHNINVDDIGIGRGVKDRLRELGIAVNGVSTGNPARDKEKHANLNMELSWRMRDWINRGNSLSPCAINQEDKWEQLTWYRYKVDSDKRMKMEKKVDMKTTHGSSPDFGDSLRLTFYRPPKVGIIKY